MWVVSGGPGLSKKGCWKSHGSKPVNIYPWPRLQFPPWFLPWLPSGMKCRLTYSLSSQVAFGHGIFITVIEAPTKTFPPLISLNVHCSSVGGQMFQSIYSLPNKLQNLLQLPSSGQKTNKTKKSRRIKWLWVSLIVLILFPTNQFLMKLLDSLLTSYSSRWIFALAFFVGGWGSFVPRIHFSLYPRCSFLLRLGL